MDSITVTKHVTLPDNTRSIDVQVKSSGIRVKLDDLHSPGYDKSVVALKWEQLDDVELLADKFDTEAVRTFKVLVGMLGEIYNNKHNIFEVFP